MFIESPHGEYFNLLLLAAYRRNEKKGEYILQFAVEGGRVVVGPDHPQYRAIDRHIRAATLPHDAA